MKKTIIVLTVSALLSALALSSCESPSSKADKVEAAKEEVAEAHQNLDDATAAYQADVEKYKRETTAKVAANNQSIAGFKARIADEKSEVKAEYERKITQLEGKNNDMKKLMDDYKMEGREKWDAFKTEFNRDMEELGHAFKDLAVNNVK